jgi:hypothetical protein
MAYTDDDTRGYTHDGNAYEMPSVQQPRTGGYVMAGDNDDQDDVPIHTRRQSRLGNAPRYSGYDAGGNRGYDVDAYMAPAAQTRQSSYGGGGYTDSPHMQERYNNPFEQPSPQQVDFDVMADFNNAGPRYSNLYGKGTDESMRELVKSGGRPITYVPFLQVFHNPNLPSPRSYRPQTAHSELSKPYRPRSTLDADPTGESAIERSYSTRHSTRDPTSKTSRKQSRRGKPLLAGADWDNSRHDGVFGEGDHPDGVDDEGYADSGWRRGGGKARFDTKAKDVNGVELVTVPALGSEYVRPFRLIWRRTDRVTVDGGKTKQQWAHAGFDASCRMRNERSHGRNSRGISAGCAVCAG